MINNDKMMDMDHDIQKFSGLSKFSLNHSVSKKTVVIIIE